MIGAGTLANAGAIVAGSVVGLAAGRGIKEKYQETVLYGLCLCVMMLGLQMAFQGKHIMITISSLVLGSIIGEAMDIEAKLERYGTWLAKKVQSRRKTTSAGDEGAFVQGFMYASLIYCVGAMAIVGSIQDGLGGDPTTLYTKAALDGLSGIIYAANMGVGVLFSALSVLVYQGALTALAGLLGPYMSPEVVQEIAASGGLMIFGIGINMTKLLKIRIGNMLPGLVVAGVAAVIFL